LEDVMDINHRIFVRGPIVDENFVGFLQGNVMDESTMDFCGFLLVESK